MDKVFEWLLSRPDVELRMMCIPEFNDAIRVLMRYSVDNTYKGTAVSMEEFSNLGNQEDVFVDILNSMYEDILEYVDRRNDDN